MVVQSLILLATISLLVEARLKINITVGSFRKDVKVQTNGSDLKLVTEKEIQMFNMTNNNLNRGFVVELAKAPDNLFLKDPTYYEDLFQYYEWEQVKRKMTVKKVRILETVSEDVVLKRQSFINYSSDTVRSNVSVFANVQTTIYSSWGKQGILSDEIYYDLIINLHNHNFTYVNKWGDDKPRSRNLAFGTAEKGYIEAKPGETMNMKLSAHKTIVLIEITYAAVMTGQIIGDYENLYGKYHFYAPAVKDIMKAANLKNEILTKELIEIRCFTSPKLDVVNGRGRKVYVIRPPMPVLPEKKNVTTTTTTTTTTTANPCATYRPTKKCKH